MIDNNKLLDEIQNVFDLIISDYIKLKDIDFVEDFKKGYEEKNVLTYNMGANLEILTDLVNHFLNPKYGRVKVFINKYNDLCVSKQYFFVKVDHFKVGVLKDAFEKCLLNYDLGMSMCIGSPYLICLPI